MQTLLKLSLCAETYRKLVVTLSCRTVHSLSSLMQIFPIKIYVYIYCLYLCLHKTYLQKFKQTSNFIVLIINIIINQHSNENETY